MLFQLHNLNFYIKKNVSGFFLNDVQILEKKKKKKKKIPLVQSLFTWL